MTDRLEILDTKPEQAVTLVKRGETCVNVDFFRTTKGVSVKIHTHPSVEEFFRGISNNEQVAVRTHGRYWEPAEKGVELQAWALNHPINHFRLDDGTTTVRMDYLGQQILGADDGSRNRTLQLGFLRLVGTSNGGVKFNLKGVYTPDALMTLRDAVAEASAKFYRLYLKPMNLSVVVSTQDLMI